MNFAPVFVELIAIKSFWGHRIIRTLAFCKSRSSEMQFMIYDKSTKVPRGACPRRFGNGRASFERAWTRRSTTALTSRHPLHFPTPLFRLKKCSITLFTSAGPFFRRSGGWIGGRWVWGCCWLASDLVRAPSLFFADFFLYLTGIGFLQDAEAARRP